MRERLEERSQDPLRLRDRVEQNIPRGCAQSIVQSEIINTSRVQGGRDQFGADEKPQDRQSHWPEVPGTQLSQRAFALEDDMHRAIGSDEQSHVFLAGEDSDQPPPMCTERTPKPRVKHQEKERRSERLRVKFMERDIAGRGRDQHRTRQEERRFSVKAESSPDAECHRPHRSEGGVLHHDEEPMGGGRAGRAGQSERRSVRHDSRGAGHLRPTPGTAHG